MRRTQLYLDDDQYRWLKQRAGRRGSMAAVIRDLIEVARSDRPDPIDDPFVVYLLDEPPAKGKSRTTVTTLDDDLYG